MQCDTTFAPSPQQPKPTEATMSKFDRGEYHCYKHGLVSGLKVWLHSIAIHEGNGFFSSDLLVAGDRHVRAVHKLLESKVPPKQLDGFLVQMWKLKQYHLETKRIKTEKGASTPSLGTPGLHLRTLLLDERGNPGSVGRQHHREAVVGLDRLWGGSASKRSTLLTILGSQTGQRQSSAPRLTSISRCLPLSPRLLLLLRLLVGALT